MKKAVEYGRGKTSCDTISFVEGAAFVTELLKSGETVNEIIENARISKREMFIAINYVINLNKTNNPNNK